MALDIAAITETTWEPVREDQAHQYTALVIWDGSAYSALCRELDIASCGDTAAEAFVLLKAAVREATEVAAEHHIAIGQPVTDEVLADFMASHKAPQPIAGFVFSV